MEAKIVTIPAFTVAGMLYRGKNENREIPQLWQKFGPRMQEIKHAVKEPIAYGVMDNFDAESGEFDYMAALKVSSAEDIPEGMASWEIPESKYAVASCTLPTIHEIFKALYDWIPASGYERAPGPELEWYDERFDPEQPHSELDIYIPIK